MLKRRFEFVSGKSYKFWEIAVSGCQVTVTFGRIGTDGQSQAKTFHNDDEAARHAAKQVAAKTKKGYAEVDCSEVATA
ncbi:MAG: WGR domain-containing protein [Planctomycetaceae bacterium]|nr:WGR domain-containing protein [Planctomycetales bacterium]MCB9925371.1 WGR domain-containing protein [Planctomycetaceae bacterium]